MNTASPATPRKVSTVEPAVREVSAENPMPMPHTEARITAVTPTTASSVRTDVPPIAIASP